MATTINIIVGSHVWLEDPKLAWIDGEVVHINGQEVHVHITTGKTVREKYKLEDPKSFHYLNQSKCYELDGVDDAQEYLATKRAMDVVGINEEEQRRFGVVAAVLHLGNVDFAKGKEIDPSVIKDEKSKFHLNMTAQLLKCDAKSLEDALINRVMVTPEEIITRTLGPVSALSSRDALAKTIYSRLFDWLVEKINISIGQDPNSKAIICVLDIYGFESFKHNSLSSSASILQMKSCNSTSTSMYLRWNRKSIPKKK